MTQGSDGTGAAAAEQTSYSMSGGMVALLARLGVSVAFTSYMSGILYLLGRDERGAHVHQTGILRPMGVACSDASGLVLASGHRLIQFSNPLEPHERANRVFDACYAPRGIHVTGDLDIHDVGVMGDGQIVFVNTRYNCLATIDARHSFAPFWQPPFISAIVDEDRCHINGLAMRDGAPAFVTACSKSDTIDGWRDRRMGGGVVIDVAADRVICEGLSMPHSPRWHDGRLWVLNSGTGELGVVEGFEDGMGHFVPRVFCPGFVRGLAFHGGYAFVGLSKPRYHRFEGLELDGRLKAADSEPWCGVQVIDLERGACAEWFRIDGSVAELYDVALLPGVSCPMAISPETPEAAGLVTWAGSASAPPPASSAALAPVVSQGATSSKAAAKPACGRAAKPANARGKQPEPEHDTKSTKVAT